MQDSSKKAQVPARLLDQRMEALERATEVRVKRSELKAGLKTGEVEIAAILRHPPDYVQTAKLIDLLLALPGVGPARVSRLLTQCRISEAKTVGGMSERQRDVLVARLEA
jgi:hypothetical protein